MWKEHIKMAPEKMKTKRGGKSMVTPFTHSLIVLSPLIQLLREQAIYADIFLIQLTPSLERMSI